MTHSVWGLSWTQFLIKGQPGLSVRVEEQFFNDNFIAHQNDFVLNAGYYDATFSRNALDMVHDEANNGEF